MRSWVRIVALATLAACRGEPRAPGERGAASAEQPDGRAADAQAPVTAARPQGDRHARAAARRTHVVKRIGGTLARSDDRAIVIREHDAPPVTLRVTPGTTVTLDGRPARPDALPPGAEVRAAYRTGDGGLPTAISVEARRAGQPSEGVAAPDAGQPPGAHPWHGFPEPALPPGG